MAKSDQIYELKVTEVPEMISIIEEFAFVAEVVTRSQAILAGYSCPDGNSAKEIVSKLIRILYDEKLLALQDKYVKA